MNRINPIMTVIVGNNGAGKSPITRQLGTENGKIIDWDALVKQQNIDYLTVGKQDIHLVEWYIKEKINFSIETKLSSRIIFKQIETAKLMGYDIKAYYIGLKDINLHILRVQERTRRGGHFIPEEDIRRRYDRSLKNLLRLVRLSEEITIIENSSKPVQLLRFQHNQLVFNNDNLSHWVIENLQLLL